MNDVIDRMGLMKRSVNFFLRHQESLPHDLQAGLKMECSNAASENKKSRGDRLTTPALAMNYLNYLINSLAQVPSSATVFTP